MRMQQTLTMKHHTTVTFMTSSILTFSVLNRFYKTYKPKELYVIAPCSATKQMFVVHTTLPTNVPRTPKKISKLFNASSIWLSYNNQKSWIRDVKVHHMTRLVSTQ